MACDDHEKEKTGGMRLALITLQIQRTVRQERSRAKGENEYLAWCEEAVDDKSQPRSLGVAPSDSWQPAVLTKDLLDVLTRILLAHRVNTSFQQLSPVQHDSVVMIERLEIQ